MPFFLTMPSRSRIPSALNRFSVRPVAISEISAAAQLTIQAYQNQLIMGAQSQKYVIVGAGADTYVVADTDNVRGFDHVVLLKNVSSSLVTADMFMGA